MMDEQYGDMGDDQGEYGDYHHEEHDPYAQQGHGQYGSHGMEETDPNDPHGMDMQQHHDPHDPHDPHGSGMGAGGGHPPPDGLPGLADLLAKLITGELGQNTHHMPPQHAHSRFSHDPHFAKVMSAYDQIASEPPDDSTLESFVHVGTFLLARFAKQIGMTAGHGPNPHGAQGAPAGAHDPHPSAQGGAHDPHAQGAEDEHDPYGQSQHDPSAAGMGQGMGQDDGMGSGGQY